MKNITIQLVNYKADILASHFLLFFFYLVKFVTPLHIAQPITSRRTLPNSFLFAEQIMLSVLNYKMIMDLFVANFEIVFFFF